MKTDTKAPGMTGEDVLKAIGDVDAIFIGVTIGTDSKIDFMKWRDKSEAMRKRVRRLIGDAMKRDPERRFRASVSEAAGEKILTIGGAF